MEQTFSARRRPFAVPASVDDLDGPSVSGLIVLPQHLDWSSRRSYDLDDPRDRRRVYEIVLREGTLEDLRRYVDADELVAVFDELFLPEDIRAGWRQLIAEPGGETVQLDLSHDARHGPSEASELGPTLSQDELAADKVLALFGRAEARDFADVAALLEVYSPDRLIELAGAKDPGFSQERFSDSLAAIHRLDEEDFLGTGRTCEELASQFDAWREQLDRSRGS